MGFFGIRKTISYLNLCSNLFQYTYADADETLILMEHNQTVINTMAYFCVCRLNGIFWNMQNNLLLKPLFEFVSVYLC